MQGRCWNFCRSVLLLISAIAVSRIPDAGAQDFFLNPVLLNDENGLPNNSIHVISKDSRGFIWIGTDGGLCRYDGSAMENFADNAGCGSFLSDNRIFDVVEDTVTGNMWVSAVNGLGVLDVNSGACRIYRADRNNPDSLVDNTIRTVFQDAQGELWVSCWTQGLLRYHRGEDRFERYFFELPDSSYALTGVNPSRINSVVAIAQDPGNDNVLWLATIAGLLRLDKSTRQHRFFYFDLPDENTAYLGNSFTDLYIHKDGLLYLGSFAMASVFDPRTEAFRPVEANPGNDAPPFHRVHAIRPKSPEELWITYEDGAAIYHCKKQRTVYLAENNYRLGHYYGAWLIDEKRRLWNGTLKDGVFVYDPLRQQARDFPLEIRQKNLGYTPQQILESPDGSRLYLCVEDGEGLYILDKERGEWSVARPPAPYFEKNKAFQGVDMAWSKQGQLLVLESEQLFTLSSDQRRLLPTPLPMEEDTYRFRRLLRDRSGNLWLTSRRVGVFRLDATDGSARHFMETLNDSLTTNLYIWIEHIFEDSRGWIWIRLARSFCIYQPEYDRFLKFPYQPGDSPNTYRYLRNFAEDRYGRVWVASEDEGIGLTDPEHPERGVVRKITASQGLPSNKIQYIEADAGGNIWILSDLGLERLDPETLTFEHFGRGYGIPAKGTVLQTLASGEMALGYQTGGVSIFHPDSLRLNREVPRPYVTSFRVFDEEKADATQLIDGGTISLSYRQNFFSLEFSTISYTNSEDNEFAYRLEGFEADWNQAGTRRYAAYTNVPGGDYTFLLRASNNEKQWSDEIYALKIRISTPWWQTWAFRSLLLVLLAGGAWSVYKYRINSIRHDERLRSEFEKKLANVEMSALRAQMNPHFIFNCLNSIDYYILKNETEKASDYLNRFSRLIRLILQNSSVNHISLKDELEALRLYMDMESLRFDNKFSYRLIVEGGLEPEQVEIPPMLLQPYVENAIWHGLMHRSGHGNLELTLSQNNGYLKCIIQDDGIGREKAQQLKSKTSVRKKSMGMRITSDRIELINRLYDMQTSVKVIDLKDEQGSPRGPRVELDIPL